jgi:hypothetical protein
MRGKKDAGKKDRGVYLLSFLKKVEDGRETAKMKVKKADGTANPFL